MKHLKKLTLTLVLLITAATGAWADDATYTVQFKANGKTVTRDVTLPHTFWCNVDNANGELDGIIMELYGWTGDGGVNYYCISTSTPQSTDPNKVKAGNTNSNHYITIDSKFDGTVTVSGRYSTSFGQATYSLDISFFVPAGTFSINDAKSEATMKMPQYDVTATYTLKRDMTVDVEAGIASSIRIKKDGNTFEPVGADGNIDANAALPTVTDNLDAEEPVTMTEGTDKDYTLTLQKQSETDETAWTDVTDYSVGIFRYKVTGTGNYSGEIITETFKLFEGIPVVVPPTEEQGAGEEKVLGTLSYINDEFNLTLDANAGAKLYVITGVGTETATATEVTEVPKGKPFFVLNEEDTENNVTLLPVDDAQVTDAVTPAAEFLGTLVDKTFTADEMAADDYYVLQGGAFVFVKNAGTLAANHCYLKVAKDAAARRLKIVFGDEDTVTGIEGVKEVEGVEDDRLFDLNGRQLDGTPTRKGLYIRNGKKVVIR